MPEMRIILPQRDVLQRVNMSRTGTGKRIRRPHLVTKTAQVRSTERIQMKNKTVETPCHGVSLNYTRRPLENKNEHSGCVNIPKTHVDCGLLLTAARSEKIRGQA